MKKLFTLALLSTTLTFANVSQAGLINIDFSTFSPGSALNYASGISFSLLGSPDSAGDPSIATSGGLLTNSRHGGAYPTANILQFTFDDIASNVSFIFQNAGTGTAGGRGDSFFEAFDITGSLLETGSLNGAAYSPFSLAATGIKTIQFNNHTSGASSWWFGVASISATTTAVPEPTPLILLSLGLAGIYLSRKKAV